MVMQPIQCVLEESDFMGLTTAFSRGYKLFTNDSNYEEKCYSSLCKVRTKYSSTFLHSSKQITDFFKKGFEVTKFIPTLLL